MATLAEIARQQHTLTGEQVVHLQQLVAEWGLLADLSFSDLLLYVPSTTAPAGWVVLAQVRPATARTIYDSDYVGESADSAASLLDEARRTGTVCEADVSVAGLVPLVHTRAIPVRHHGEVVAVLCRETLVGETRGAGELRTPGALESTYLSVFERFCTMVAEGTFPSEGPLEDSSAAPRLGDGTILLDGEARVLYASPNAMSVFHRVGITSNAVGMSLAELGFDDGSARKALESGRPVIDEVEQTSDVTLLSRCLPIIEAGRVTGGLLLVRDVTEVRTRDKLLLSKDATIREVHHRVKNNLQTISSLLRLQGRRLVSPEAKAAVNESVRRIRTIAVVHETLSRETGDDVAFIDIVRPLLRLSEEGLQSQDRPIRFSLRGDGGRLPTTVATPLSVVLIELLQNAIEHGFPEGSSGGEVAVLLERSPGALTIRVLNDGVGLEPGFELDQATGLGLSIVRTLVTTELAGSITMRAGSRADFEAVGIDGMRDGMGTVVQLTVPM